MVTRRVHLAVGVEELPLFLQPTLPPAHHDAERPERDAAESARAGALSLRVRIDGWLQRRGKQGATRDEIDQVFGVTPNVTQPRLVELEDARRIYKTEARRLTRSGRLATVYVHCGIGAYR